MGPAGMRVPIGDVAHATNKRFLHKRVKQGGNGRAVQFCADDDGMGPSQVNQIDMTLQQTPVAILISPSARTPSFEGAIADFMASREGNPHRSTAKMALHSRHMIAQALD